MKTHPTDKKFGWRGASIAGLALALLAGCEEGAGGLQSSDPANIGANAAPGEVIERDVEDPGIFGETDKGLWDGRPSLGGIWIAHPEVGQPERVVIRNLENSKSVTAALFRRERLTPGPIFQVSSEAAVALGMLAGSPAELSVVALRRETVEVAPPPEPEPVAAPEPEPAPEPEVEKEPEPAIVAPVSDANIEAGEISETPLDAVATAAAAIDEAESGSAEANEPKKNPWLTKPFVQAGVFSIEDNANVAADQLREAGLEPTIEENEAGENKTWRVIVGPAQTRAERNATLKTVRSSGFGDAFSVAN